MMNSNKNKSEKETNKMRKQKQGEKLLGGELEFGLF